MDLIINYSPSSSDFSLDQIERLITLSYDEVSEEYISSGRQNILDEQTYYPYFQIKSNYPEKIHFSSSIRQRTNFMTGEAIRDSNQNPIPVNVHSRLIKDDTGNFIGHIYSVVSASNVLDVVDELSDSNKPAILTNRAGSLFYSKKTLTFTEVTGYYETILEAGFDTTTVDRDGYQGEITIYRQIAIDIDQSQTLLIAKVLPRNVIFRSLQNVILQAILTLIVSVSLATVLALVVTRSLTKRLRMISEAADQISKGKLEDVKLDLNGSDELANLNRSFYRMTKSLKIYLKDEEE